LQKKYKIFLLLTPACLLCDQVVKTVVRETLAPMRSIEIIPGFWQLRYAENTGMAFGMLPNLPEAYRVPLFSVITLIAAAIIFHLFRQAPGRSLRLPAALSMILSGALGNLTDRFRWGVVVDFIRVQIWPPSHYFWPTFNLADVFISVGIALLILDTLLAGEGEPALSVAEDKHEAAGSSDYPEARPASVGEVNETS